MGEHTPFSGLEAAPVCLLTGLGRLHTDSPWVGDGEAFGLLHSFHVDMVKEAVLCLVAGFALQGVSMALARSNTYSVLMW